jgi:hypothetical protein
MKKTHIMFNGSKWAGQPPDPLETLLDMLDKEPLDPRFKRFDAPVVRGDYPLGVPEEFEGTHHFHGNFYRVSHPFSVFTNDKDVIAKLTAACEKNIASDAYKAAAREICRG